MLSSIYLTGSDVDPYSNLLANAQSVPDWRSVALTKLQSHGLRVINPLELAWPRMDVSEQTVPNQVFAQWKESIDPRVRRSLDLIDHCDALLANLSKPSYGTAMEIFYAYQRKKIVTVFGQPSFSPWVLSHSQARFTDMDNALDYIIDEQPQIEPLQWALQYESLLADRYEELPRSGDADYKFIGGEIPVLVAAPHATAFFRDGEFQEAEAFTGSMATLLNRLCNCHALITNYCCVADPCSYLETPFCRALVEIVKAGRIGFVLILVGASWHEAPGLQIQFKDQAIEEQYANRLKLQLLNLEQAATQEFDSRLGDLPKFISDELGVPTVVLKMHKRYRMPRIQPNSFSILLEAINQFLLTVANELARG